MTQNSFRHIIINLLAALFTVATLAACNSMEEPDTDRNDIAVSFRLFTGNPGLTRAVDEYGNAIENYIDLKSFKILIFDENQTLKQVLYENGNVVGDHTSFTQLSPGCYLVQTLLNKDAYAKSSKFAVVALANWKSEDTRLIINARDCPVDMSYITKIGSLTIADLKGMTFTVNPRVAEGETQPETWMPHEKSGIPMFGSSYSSLEKYDNRIYGEGNPMPLPDVNLVRALTKIEVINKDTGGGPSISRIDLTYRNQTGTLVQDYEYTSATGNVAAPTIPDNHGYTIDPIPFHHNTATDTYTIYIPEMEFGTTRQAIRINIDWDETRETKWIYLLPYDSNGQPLLDRTDDFDWKNIKRNYIYQYEINSLAFEFVIEVEPWVFGGKVHIDMDEEIDD